MDENRTGRTESFLTLLRPLRRELEVYCRRLIWNEHDAPEALQNAMMNGFKAFDRYHEDSNFRGWMLKILTHEVFKLNRKHARLAQLEYQVEPDELDAPSTVESNAGYRDWLNTPDALADALDQRLLAALKTLTEAERAVLLMRAIGEFRYREIAEALEMPLGSVMETSPGRAEKCRAPFCARSVGPCYEVQRNPQFGAGLPRLRTGCQDQPGDSTPPARLRRMRRAIRAGAAV